MKRTLALVLALIMILCMIPASMLTAFARGRGVYMNDVTNQTIENAPGQYIPETVVIDGVLDDTGWREDDWKRVNSESGTWNVQYPTKNQTINNETFAYKYNVRKDYYYLYGAFVVPTNEAGLVKLWLNNDAKGRNSCSHVFTFDITGKVSGGVAAYSGNGTWKRETADGVAVKDKSTYYFEKSKVVFQADGEFTNIEFKVLLADFCPAANPSIDYFVSVDTKTPVESDPNGDYEALYHPAIEIDEEFDRDLYFPSMTNWVSEFAGEITTEDLNGLGEHSFIGDIDINGEFDEAEWAQHTDFYSRWYERTNVTDYKDNVNFMKPYSDLVYNKSLWNATSNWSAEHDLRVTANYIHGAAVISVPADTTTNNIRFNMFQVVNENTIWQTTVYLHSSTGNFIDSAQFTFYENGVPVVSYDVESDDIHKEGYFNCNRNLTINNETVGVTVFSGGTRVIGSPGLYSFEFRIDRRFAPDFAPTVYDFCMAPDDTSRYWSCDNRYDGSTTTGDGNEQHPGYTKEAANLKQAYYPITHFNNQFGLDEIGASDAEVEYYEPYTLYTPDGYLGVKAWPGLTFSAGGPNNADFVNSGNSDRLKNLNYLHSLRSDYEFVYGALSVQAEADSPFKNWKLGTETSPNGGDYFTLWVMVPDETGTRYRFDIWAYENPNYDPNDSTTGPQYFAQIAGVDGNGNYVIKPETGAKAAFVNRENSADKDRYYAIEYKIALSSVQAKLNIGIDTTEQIADYLSTPIFEYYTSLSVANDDKTAYASMLWPRSGNGNLLPDDDGFLWNKEVNSNKIYGNPQALRYQDVIRVVEPDGRIVEELRFDLDEVNFSDSEYRDISKYSNFFTAKEEFYVGRDYAYLGAEIDGDVSSYNTKVILWIKNSTGIHNYEFGHNGANATMKYDGNVVSDTTYVDQYGMTSTNGKTYFEAILDMDRFGADEGFEYYVEIQQRVNGENLSRVFSDDTKKITLPTIDYGSQINTVKSWYQNAGSVEDLIHFPREEITIDGNLNDNGWDNGEWVYVSTDINANLQEADTHKDAFKTDFYYQLRVDDEYLYVAAVIFYSDCTYAANQTNITASEPGFRIWLKSGREGQNVLNGDSRTYTDYYGMYINKSGEIVFGSKKNTMPTYPNNTRNLYNKYYAPVVPLRDADGKLVYENGKVKYTYDAKGLSTAYTRFDGDTVYPSDLFGYTEYIINEQEANKNVDETEVLKGETINPEDYEAEGMLAGSNKNVEQGIMRFGGDANYSQKFDHGRIETLGNDSTVVEFKVKLDEFGGHDEFQYMVTASSNTQWAGGTRSTMYPAITSEAGSRDNYFHYYYPYWHWVDDTSVTVTEEVRADMTLLTYKRPVITLGAKVSKTYMYQGKETNALRMGGLWEEKYIRKTKELAENNGYWPDKSGDPNWVDYWDLKAMGMVVIPTYLLKENTNITSERPGKYDLFKGTKNSVWMDADGIVKWQGDLDDGDERNNYADYKNFAFYVTVVNVPTNVNFCFRGFADYYDEVLDACPSYYDVVLERSIDMVIDSAIRTEDNNKEEEDNALPGGDFSRDDESGFTGTDGSDHENSIDPSEDVSEDVSDDTSVAPGITTEKDGAELDIAWPTGFHETTNGFTNSLVFADSAGTGFSVGGFYATTDDDGNTTTFPNTQLSYWKKLYFTQNADGTLTLQNIEGSDGTEYASWQINSGVLVVAYHPDNHPNRAVFDSYKVGETFVLEGMTLNEIGGTSTDAELDARLKRVIVCSHTAGWNAATCTEPETCKNCGAVKPGSYPLGHKYDENDVQDCLTGINCTVCGYEKAPALGHTNGTGKWTYNNETHWWTCTREDCPEPNVKRNEAAHTFKNGKCSVCGYACEHPYGEGNFHEAVDATCGVSGNIAYYECECGLKFTDANCTTPVADVIIPALEHDYDEETGICNNCGDELTPTVVGRLEHAYPGKYYENGNGGYYTMVFSDSTNAPHSLRGWTRVTGKDTANSTYFPMPDTDGNGGDLAWWYKISFKKINTVDGREYFVVQAICKPATYTDETNTTISVDLSYLADLSDLTAEEKANHPWYIDEDTMVVAVPSSSEYWDEIAELVEGDVVYISGDTAYTFAQTGSTAADTLLTDANGQFGTYLTLHKHKWVAATCTEPKHCRECGEQDPEDTALGHTLGAEATCTTAQLCTTCHAVIVPALGHNYDNYVTEDAATCTTNETETGKCTRCDATDTRDIENTKLGHEFKTYVSNNNAICGKDGTKTAKCERCDVTDTIVDEGTALGHDWIDADCDTPKTCDRCGETEGDALGHSWVDADCDTPKTCSACGITEGEALGHSWVDATCTAPKTCSVCGETEGEALGHTPGAAATCTTAQTCTVCGTELAGKLPHTPGAAADCVNDQICTVCGEVIKAALGHTPGDPATCTTAQTCTVCSQVVVEALGHTEGPVATCTTDQICTVCGEVLVEAYGHTWGENPEDGAQCTRCGETYVAFVPVEIPLNYLNAYDADTNKVYVYAASDYTDVPTGFDWWNKVLLEYDDVSGYYRVVAVDTANSTAYTVWDYGVDRIFVFSFVDNTNSKISELNVDDYLELSGTTHETLKGASGAVNITLTTVDYKGSGDITAPQVLTPILKEPVYNKFEVAYIPLDDRPVHTDRVIYEAEAAGITLLMPPNAEDYKTYLGTSGHGGNPANLLAWLREQEENGVDYYVIALDQIFSGGLVNSRYSDSSFNGQFTEQDQEIADFLVELAKNNYVVYTETIMRLAATSGYREHNSNTYNGLRGYGIWNRLALSEEGTGINALTLEHVISGYRYGSNGLTANSRGGEDESGNWYTIDESTVKGYIGARERKLRIIDYLVRNAGGNINSLFVGMDDSSSGENIQANERRYIEMIIEKCGVNGTVFAGADEMGLMGIAALTSSIYVPEKDDAIPGLNGATGKVPVNVIYYGPAADYQADKYDNGTLRNSVNLHIKALNGYQVAAGYEKAEGVLQVLVLTRGQTSVESTDTTNARAYAANLVAELNANLDADIPTCLIDASNHYGGNVNNLPYAMYWGDTFTRDDFNEILGYSSWNTVGNAVGIALSNAFARYNYIMNTDVVSKTSNLGFLKQLTFSNIKDTIYRAVPSTGWNMDTPEALGFTGNGLLGYINASTNMLLKGGVSDAYDHVVSVDGVEWHSNWNRDFECWLTINVASDEIDESLDKVAGGGVALPDEDFQ